MSLTEGLTSLGAESEDVEYAKVGYSHLHTVSAESLASVASLFRSAEYVLEQITCQDRREELEKMRLVYQFNRLGQFNHRAPPDRHLLHADVEVGQPAPTITGVYRAADWFEREVYDMYGVEFADHPNPKRLLLPEDADFHALLKDFGRIDDVAGEDAEEAEPVGTGD